MPKFTVQGLDTLQKVMNDKAKLADLKRVVRHNGSELQRKIQKNADFDKGYQTGTTKRSVGLEIRDGGLTADAGPETEYSPYVEYGTRFMEAQPFVRPAFEEQKEKFKNDMDKLVR